MHVTAIVPAAGAGTPFRRGRSQAVPAALRAAAARPGRSGRWRPPGGWIASILVVPARPGDPLPDRDPGAVRSHRGPAGTGRGGSAGVGVRRTGRGPAETDLVLVHDGARPLVTPEIVRAAVQVAATEGAAVVAVPVTDTIKMADADGRVVETPPRGPTVGCADTAGLPGGVVARGPRTGAGGRVPGDRRQRPGGAARSSGCGWCRVRRRISRSRRRPTWCGQSRSCGDGRPMTPDHVPMRRGCTAVLRRSWGCAPTGGV